MPPLFCPTIEGVPPGEERRNSHGGGSPTMENPKPVTTSPKPPPPTSAVESFMNLVDGCTVTSIRSATVRSQHPCCAGLTTTNASSAAEELDDEDTDDCVDGKGSVGRAFDYIRKIASSCGCSLTMLVDELRDDDVNHEGRIIGILIKKDHNGRDITMRDMPPYKRDISLLTEDTPCRFQKRYYAEDVSDGMVWYKS
ncbi:hypothetical protein ACHAXA_008048 [Cyclostephanos tholiformis]|uniref:Uncharacterized protein n=1 Tax=Cyclostephanos tholiformis TaxID=382380 RepID=A0ABD3R0Y7_9STRA